VSAAARTLLGWTLVGVALRLLFLPATAHPDLLTLYDRIRVWNDGAFRLEEFHVQALPMLLHRAWAGFGVPLPDLSSVRFPGTIAEYERASADVLAPSATFGWVLLWKLPYVVCDLLCILLLVRLVPREQAGAVARLWLIHPLVIYVGAVYGRYDAVMLLPLLAGFLLLGRGRPGLAFACIGLSGALRIYPFLVLVPAVLASSGSTRARLERLAAGAAPLFAIVAAAALGGGIWWVAAPLGVAALALAYRRLAGTRAEPFAWAVCLGLGVWLLPSIGRALYNPTYPLSYITQHAEYLQRISVGARESDAVLLFFVAYGAACLWAHLRGLAGQRSPDAARDDAVAASALAALGFFAFSHFHPQYAILLVPLALWAVPRARDGLAAHALQVAGLALYLLVDRNGLFSVKLLLPLAPQEIQRVMPAPEGYAFFSESGLELRAVGRTLLVVGSAWMAWDLVARRGPRAGPAGGAALWRASVAAWPLLFLALVAVFLAAPARRAVGAEFMVDTSDGLMPSDLLLATGPVAPSAIELVAPNADPTTAGKGVRASATPEDGGPTFSTWIPDSESKPGGPSRVVLDLQALGLEPQRTYRIELEPENHGTSMPTRVTPLGPEESFFVPVLRSARARIADWGAASVAWLGGAALLFAAGIALVLSGRSPGRATAAGGVKAALGH
jgi:hypothetical protein